SRCSASHVAASRPLSFYISHACPRHLPSFPTRRSSDLYKGTMAVRALPIAAELAARGHQVAAFLPADPTESPASTPVQFVRAGRSEEHTSELQSLTNLVCRLLLEKKKRRHQSPRRRLAH